MSLRLRSVILLAALLFLGGAVALAMFTGISRGIAQRLAQDFAVRHVLWQQARVGGLLSRDLALAGKLVESAPIRRWAMAESDPELSRWAMSELNSFGRFFSSGQWFVALRESNHYYLNDAAGSRDGNELLSTMSRERPGDSWFYTALDHPAKFHLNVDRNVDLGETKVWINVSLEDERGRRLGVAGTGVDLSRFIEEFIHSEEEGVSTMLLNPSGAILAHEDPRYITANLHSLDPSQWSMFSHLLDGDSDRAVLSDALRSISEGGSESVTFNISMNKRRYVAAIAPIPEINWLSLALVDLDSVVGVHQLAWLGAVLGGVMLVVVLGMALLLDRLVLAPIRVAASGAGRIAAGDYQVRLPLGRKDEIGELSAAFNRMSDTVEEHTRTLEERVARRTSELREANRQLTAGILYARHLQASLLPDEEQLRRLLPDSFLIWQQRDGVGGDFCLLHQDEEHLLVGVADCTGHGVAGALMTMTAHTLFRQVLKELGPQHPALLLAALNRTLRQVLHSGAVSDSDHRATPGAAPNEHSYPTVKAELETREHPDNGLEMALCVFNRKSNRLTFAGAGLPLYIVRPGEQGEGAGVVEIIRGERSSIGYRRSNPEQHFPEHEINCAPDTIYYLATDGILDQAGGPKGLSFGNRRFRELLAPLAPLEPTARKNALLAALSEYQGEKPQRDDLTVMGFKGLGRY